MDRAASERRHFSDYTESEYAPYVEKPFTNRTRFKRITLNMFQTKQGFMTLERFMTTQTLNAQRWGVGDKSLFSSWSEICSKTSFVFPFLRPISWGYTEEEAGPNFALNRMEKKRKSLNAPFFGPVCLWLCSREVLWSSTGGAAPHAATLALLLPIDAQVNHLQGALWSSAGCSWAKRTC